MQNQTGGRYWNDLKTWNLVKENQRGCNKDLENITMIIKLFYLCNGIPVLSSQSGLY